MGGRLWEALEQGLFPGKLWELSINTILRIFFLFSFSNSYKKRLTTGVMLGTCSELLTAPIAESEKGFTEMDFPALLNG